MTNDQQPTNEQENVEGEVQDNPVHTFTQQIEVTSNQVMEKIRELIQQGNVRRIKIITADNRVLLDTPLNFGAGVAGVMALFGGLPILLVTTGIAVLAKVKIEVVREAQEGDIVEGNRVSIDIDAEDDLPSV